MEAVPGAVHDPVRAAGTTRRADPLVDRRPRRRAARAGGRVRAGQPARRALGRRRRRGGRCCSPRGGRSTSRSPRARGCWPRPCCGGSSRSSSGRHRAALALLTAAALMRPEAWPFLGVYGIWLWRARPRTAWRWSSPPSSSCCCGSGPDVIGAGGAIGGSKAARGTPSPGSAGLTAHPALTLLGDTVTVVSAPRARRRRARRGPGRPDDPRARRGCGRLDRDRGGDDAAGYAGNPRYLVAAAAIIAVLAGVGAVRLAAPPAARHGARRCWRPRCSPPPRGTCGPTCARSRQRGALARHVRGMIDRAGGRDALLRCGPVRTSTTARSIVAWYLDLPIRRHQPAPAPAGERRPGALVLRRGPRAGVDPRGYDVKASSHYWRVLEQC